MAGDEPKPEAQPLALSPNKRLRKIELEEAAAKKDSAVAAARKAEVEAKKAAGDPAPEPKSKAPEGKIALGDDVGLIADLVAHSMLEEAASQLSTEINDSLGSDSKVLMVDSPDLLGADWPYLAISQQIGHEKLALEEVKRQLSGEKPSETSASDQVEDTKYPLLPAGAAATVAAIPALIGGVADIVSMFRGDYEIKARKVSIGTTPLFAALAKELIQPARTINLEKLTLLKESKLFAEFNAAAQTRLEVQRLATDLKERKLAHFEWLKQRAKSAQESYDAALKAKEPPQKENLDALQTAACKLREDVEVGFPTVADAQAKVATAEGAIERFDEFAAAITKAPESGYPPLIAAAIHEVLHSQSQDQKPDYTHVLYAAVESAGGETITRHTIFRTTARFIGGAQVSYMLWDVHKGKLVAADTMPVLGNVKLGLATGFTDPVQTVALKKQF